MSATSRHNPAVRIVHKRIIGRAPASAQIETDAHGEPAGELSASIMPMPSCALLRASSWGSRSRLLAISPTVARGLVASHIAGLVLAEAGPVEVAPAFHEAFGAALRAGTQFRFELKGADGAGGRTRSGFPGELRVLDVGGFGGRPAKGPHVLERLPRRALFPQLLRAAFAAPVPRLEQRFYGAGMTATVVGELVVMGVAHVNKQRLAARQGLVDGALPTRESTGRRVRFSTKPSKTSAAPSANEPECHS